MLKNECVNFIGNVNVGRDVLFNDLRKHYDILVLSYGAAEDRKLGIPGESGKNVVSTRSFGLPEDAEFKADLDHENAAIVGMGNVAFNVARILLSPMDELRKTDITLRALALLEKSHVKNARSVASGFHD